jgi:membrane protein
MVREIIRNARHDIVTNHTMTLAAGLSYYFVLSFFPLLILLAATLAYLPIPNLFDDILGTLAHVVPAESMGVVRWFVATVVTRHGGLLTFGLLGTLWTASSGFSGLIEALNVAYNVPETRPFWKTRLLALGLMFVVGTLLTGSLTLLLLGPLLVNWLQSATGANGFAALWPYFKWTLSVAFTVVGVELLFYWAPNVKQRFWATLPGAIIGVGFFIGSSYALGIYFQNYAHYNRTYGALGGALGLMVWLYYSWFAILIGAEINAELLKVAGRGTLELKQKPPEAVKPVEPWEAKPAA